MAIRGTWSDRKGAKKPSTSLVAVSVQGGAARREPSAYGPRLSGWGGCIRGRLVLREAAGDAALLPRIVHATKHVRERPACEYKGSTLGYPSLKHTESCTQHPQPRLRICTPSPDTFTPMHSTPPPCAKQILSFSDTLSKTPGQRIGACCAFTGVRV